MSKIKLIDSPMCIHCLNRIDSCSCELDGLPGMLRAEVQRNDKPCQGRCGKSYPEEELKYAVTSVFHQSPVASKCQKTVVASVLFLDHKTNDPVRLCKACQHKVLSGLLIGENWE